MRNQKEFVRRVARSFSISLFALPKPQRDYVLITYLLARFADTLADSGDLETPIRLAHLELWENAILKNKPSLWKISPLFTRLKPSEEQLLGRGQELLREFQGLPPKARASGARVLEVLIDTMKKDLEKIPKASSELVFAIKDESEFDEYCYGIAGCVGAYWVQIFDLPIELEKSAIQYGKALQRINVIRDIGEDLKRFRVYLPQDELYKFQISLSERFWGSEGWRLFCENYLKKTRNMLEDGKRFTEGLPYFHFRLRLASEIPFAIGEATLDLLESDLSFVENSKKISHSKVRAILLETLYRLVLKRKPLSSSPRPLAKSTQI